MPSSVTMVTGTHAKSMRFVNKRQREVVMAQTKPRPVPMLTTGAVAEGPQRPAKVVQLPGTEAARLAATGVLLERPTYRGLDRHDVVYALRDGRVGTCPLARYRLPEAVRGRVAIIPGSTDTDGLAMLPTLALIADRMAPWLDVHVVPAILRKDFDDDFGRSEGSYDIGGTRYRGAGGLALHDDDLILLQSGYPTWMAHSLCHEVMHKLWRCVLSDAARAILTAAVEDGMTWPGGYYGDIEERVCRLFQSYCWRRMEAEGPTSAGPRTSLQEMTADSLLAWIWEGTLADLAIGNGWVDASPELKAARGLVVAAPKTPPTPLLVVAARAAWKAVVWLWKVAAPAQKAAA